MAELTKQALKVENNTNFPNNNTGYITPALLREFNADMIDSTVNQTVYNTDSGSWNQQISSLEGFTGSLQTQFVTSASFQAYTQSNDAKWTNLGGQSGSWITSAQTSSMSVLSASFATTAAFALNASSVNTSSLVTTASFNAYTASTNGRLNNLESTTASLNTSVSNINSFTQSANTQLTNLAASQSIDNTKWNTLGGQSGSWVTSAITASSLVTASVNLNTITFTKGDASTFQLTVNTGSGGGGTTDISSLNAFTASQDTKNTTLQNVTQSLQSATASLFTSASNALVTGSIAGQILQFRKGDNSTFNINLPSGSGTVVTGSYAQFYDTTTQSGSANTPYALKFPLTAVPDGVILSGSTGMQVGAAGVYNIQFSLQVSQGPGAANLNVWFKKNGSNIASSDTQWTVPSNTKLVPIVNILDQAALNDVYEIWWQSDSANTTMAAIPAGANTPDVPSVIVTIFRVDVGGGTNSVTTGSFNAYTASMNAFSSSVNSFTSSINLYTQSNDTKWSTLGGLTGSYATTGSNVFIGNETLQDGAGNASTLVPTSGSIMLVAKTYTSASSHLTASAGNFVNLIFKDNSNTADTVISGSDNIFVNPNAPTAGFKRVVGSWNHFLSPTSTPQISGSIGFPLNLNGNIFSQPLVNVMNIRGPVSASTWDITGNIVMQGIFNMGASAANNFEKAAAGFQLYGNALFGGNFSNTANKTTLTSAPIVANNLVFGATINLNHSSSSISYTSNVQNGGITVNNSVTPAGGTVAGALNQKVGINTIYGVGHVLDMNGTNTSTSQAKQFYANILAGTFISSSIGTGDSCNILATAILGNSLTVTGSSTVVNATATYTPDNTQGSLFAGRFNALDGNRAKSAETILAIGTGISGSRKTGFLIDSGSNTFVEGTLNVSGSTSISGALNLTGSAYGNVVSMSITSNTASMDLSAGNYFTLTLANTATTHITATNIKPGISATLVITTGTDSSASIAPTLLQPSGSGYAATNGSGKKDVLSFVAVDNTNLFVVSTKNMI